MSNQHIEEQILAKYNAHPVLYLNFYLTGLFFFLVGFVWFWQASVFGVLIFIFGEILRRATTFYLLDNGVARGYDLFSTNRMYVEYEKIQDVEVSQSFLENLLGIGSIKFDTSGTNSIEIEFTGVSEPYTIEKRVREKMIVT